MAAPFDRSASPSLGCELIDVHDASQQLMHPGRFAHATSRDRFPDPDEAGRGRPPQAAARRPALKL